VQWAVNQAVSKCQVLLVQVLRELNLNLQVLVVLEPQEQGQEQEQLELSLIHSQH